MFKIYTGPGYPWTGIRGKNQTILRGRAKNIQQKAGRNHASTIWTYHNGLGFYEWPFTADRWSYRPDVAVGGNHRLHRHPTLLGREETTSPSRAFADE